MIAELHLQFFVGITRQDIEQIGGVIDRLGREGRTPVLIEVSGLYHRSGKLGAILFLALVFHRDIPAAVELLGQAERHRLALGLDVEALHVGRKVGHGGSGDIGIGANRPADRPRYRL